MGVGENQVFDLMSNGTAKQVGELVWHQVFHSLLRMILGLFVPLTCLGNENKSPLFTNPRLLWQTKNDKSEQGKGTGKYTLRVSLKFAASEQLSKSHYKIPKLFTSGFLRREKFPAAKRGPWGG